MVSKRCRMSVKWELDTLGVCYETIGLGVIDIMGDITGEQRNHLRMALSKSGLELMDDKKEILVDKIKGVIERMVYYEDKPPETKNSDYISRMLSIDYACLAGLFSEITGVTIEQFVISQKIERVKRLLLNGGHNLTEISYKLNYSSVAHLCRQFKKATGLTPSYYKKLQYERHDNLKMCEYCNVL